MTDEERRILEESGCILKPMPPANVFVFELDRSLKDIDEEYVRKRIMWEIKQGVVLVPSWIKLKAVTGPCTDVEVKIISPEEVRHE